MAAETLDLVRALDRQCCRTRHYSHCRIKRCNLTSAEHLFGGGPDDLLCPLSARLARCRASRRRSLNSYVRSQGTRQQPAFRLTAGWYLVIVIGCTGPEMER